MIVYNVTTKINNEVAAEWLTWLHEIHIPEIICTGCFTHARVYQLLETDEADGLTFIIQYHCKSKSLYNRYIEDHSSTLRKNAFDKWGEGFIAFRSVMQVVQ